MKSIKTIPLTQDQLNNRFEYRDGSLFYKESEGRQLKGSRAGKVKPEFNGYTRVWHDGAYYMQHRVIYKMHHGDDFETSGVLDHINGIKHDNRIENLQHITQKENTQRHYDLKHSKDTLLTNLYIAAIVAAL